MRYKFILRNEDNYPVEKMCKCMKVSKNAYYHWCKSKDVISAKSPKTSLKERIKVIFYESREIYGSCRVQQMLKREALIYSRSYVGLLMNSSRLLCEFS